MQDINNQNFLPMISISTLAQIFVGLILFLLIDRAIIVKRLRAKHRDVWVSLGSPKMFGDGKTSLGLLRFMGLRGDARKLGDQVLSALVYIHWIAVISVILAFLGIIFLGLRT